MSDGEQLLLIVSLIYLSGCLFWVDRRTMLFTSWFGSKWKAVSTDFRWGNSSGSVSFLNPLPPLGFSVVSRLMPVSLSPTNIVAYNAQTIGNSGRPRQSAKIASITPEAKFTRRGSELLVDGRAFCDIGDIVTAHKLTVLLNNIRHREVDAREEIIGEFWKERLDVRKTKKTVRVAMGASRSLRLFCSVSVLALFGLLPSIAIRYNVGFAVLLGAVALILSALIVCMRYLSCHRVNYPACKLGLGGDLAKMLLCPPTALRVCDLIMWKLSARLDILPVAFLLLHGAPREEFLSGYLSDLESPNIPEGLSDVVGETCLWQNREILKICISMIPRLGKFVETESKLKNHEGKEY